MAAAARSASTKLRRGSARLTLLNAAPSLVRKQGWAAISVEQLCAAAGVTKGAFFHHFASKDELGVAAAQHWSDVAGPLFAKADYHRHAGRLAEDFRAVLERYPARLPVTAESLANYTQTVLQGGFVLSKAHGDRAPLLEALTHLKNYLTLLFHKETLQ